MAEQKNQRIGFFDQIMYSVQPAKYKELAKQPLKAAIFYLLFLAICLTVMDYVIPAAGWMASFGGLDNLFTKVLPQIEFSKGQLQVEEPIEMGKEGTIHVLVDTSRSKFEIEELDGEKYEGEFLIARENMVAYNSYVGAMEMDFSQYQDLQFDNQKLLGIKPWIYFMLAASFFSMLFAELLRYVFSALPLAFVGFILEGPRRQGKQEKLGFSKIFVLTLYAKTAAALLVSFLVTAGLAENQEVLSYIGIFVTVFLLVTGIRKAEEGFQ